MTSDEVQLEVEMCESKGREEVGSMAWRCVAGGVWRDLH